MAKDSRISWCDHTKNFWIGCHKVSLGCKNCYAESLFTRKPKWTNTWGPPETTERLRTKSWWSDVNKWHREAEANRQPVFVFTQSLSDTFEPNPALDAWRAEIFARLPEYPWITWLMLTKHVNQVSEMVPASWLEKWPENVVLGFSAENQCFFNRRFADFQAIEQAHKIKARLFISAEPMIGPIRLSDDFLSGGLDRWVIVGGESDGGRGFKHRNNIRPMNPMWAWSLRSQCLSAGVPFHFKQQGAWRPVLNCHNPDDFLFKEGYGVFPHGLYRYETGWEEQHSPVLRIAATHEGVIHQERISPYVPKESEC